MTKKAFTWMLNVISVLCAGIVIWQFTHKKLADSSTEINEVKVGSRIDLPRSPLRLHSQTVVLALSTYCQYCRASAGFYRSLVGAGNAKGLRIVAVLREPPSVFKPFESALGIENVGDVRESSLAEMGVSATPTLFLVDGYGIIQDLWRGQLSKSQEKQVFAKLGLSDIALDQPSPKEVQEHDNNITVGAKELKLLMADPGTVVVDTRKREDFQKTHISDSLNIPYDEIVARAPHELPRDKPILLFCRFCAPCESQKEAEGSLSFCTFSDQVLQWAGFGNVKHISDDLETLAKNGVAVTGKTSQ